MTKSDKINLKYLIAVITGKIVIYGGAMWIAIHEGVVVWK